MHMGNYIYDITLIFFSSPEVLFHTYEKEKDIQKKVVISVLSKFNLALVASHEPSLIKYSCKKDSRKNCAFYWPLYLSKKN